MTGASRFDSDSISNNEPNQWRWLTLPGGRLIINPSPGKEFAPKERRWDIPPLSEKLSLNLGAFAGIHAVRLMDLLTVGLATPGGTTEFSKSRSTTWYPYKLTFTALFENGTKIDGLDYFTSATDSTVRTLAVDGAAGKVLRLAGVAPKLATLEWDEASKTLLVKHPHYICGLKIVGLEGGKQSPVALRIYPIVVGDGWIFELPLTGKPAQFAISTGFATTIEGAAKAIERAQAGITEPITKSLARTKKLTDAYLSKVPAPKNWGFKNAAGDITTSQHRRAYYAAWAFLIQSRMDVFAESADYPFPQFTLGKAALWDEGEKTSPATCAWESLFGYQWYSFIDADVAWKSFSGLMTRVDETGVLGGESLPSRKAQTAWILYKNLPDSDRLRTIYPALKRYLLWREQNPRWVYGSNKVKDEKDIEFAVSWLVDVNYAIKISDVLGFTAEKPLWQARQASMVQAMRGWFYSNPQKIEQFCFTESGKHATAMRHENVSLMITTALAVNDLPADMAQRTEAFFLSKFDPAKPLAGFEKAKHPNLDLTAYGLIDRGMPQAKPFVESMLAAAIRVGEFAEELDIKVPGLTSGVKPSLFTALNVIEFTWLLNGIRYESGDPTSFVFPNQNP